MTLTAKWIDRGVGPTCPPDPDYPYGKFVDVSDNADKACELLLKSPAPRCGFWAVICDQCKQTVILTTAGRRDDPCKVKIACQTQEATP